MYSTRNSWSGVLVFDSWWRPKTEMADIHFFYGRANCNAHEARRLYQETFPNRRIPCSRTFWRIAQRLRERGKFIQTFIRTSYVILKGYPHMNVSGYLGTCSLLDPCWKELFCLIWGGEQPREVCDIGFGTSCISIFWRTLSFQVWSVVRKLTMS